MSDYSFLIIIIALVFSVFFSGMELAFIASNRLKLELDKKNGRLSSKIISIFLSDPAVFLASMLIGNIASLVVYGIAAIAFLEPILTNNFYIHSEAVLILITIVASSILILIVVELFSKSIFRTRPNATLRILSVPALVLYILLYPLALLIVWFTNLVLTFIFGYKGGIRRGNPEPIFGTVDLNQMVSVNQNASEVNMEEEPELKIFHNVLEFSLLKVRDCMIPRTEITAVEFKTPVTELVNKFIETGYSKILIYRESIDNMIGYVSSKELYKGTETIKSRIVPLSIVPESMQVNKLFRLLIKEHKSMALVVDEYGGTSGIITLEDIMEEIFGEIEDEHDTSEFIEKQVTENEYIFSGRLEIDYLNEKYRMNFPESDEYDTLAGFIIFHFGDIPKVNSRVKIGNYEIRILKVSQTRIELVNVIMTV